MSQPAISVIVSLYNAENYVGECLESILNQTFRDFEVIVVDDCSTDNSVAIVGDYAPKFNGRLRLARTETTSGGYVAYNIGLKNAGGEYVYFVDANDFIMLNALETLHQRARQHATDVIYCSEYYKLKNPNDVYLRRDGMGKKMLKAGQEDTPAMLINKPKRCLERLFEEQEKNFYMPWTRFVKRDFLIDNEIFFAEITTGGDFIWDINVHCHAKRYLRLPTPLYFYRSYSEAAVSKPQGTPAEQTGSIVPNFVRWFAAFQELANQTKILKDNPAYCRQATLSTLRHHFSLLANVLKDLSIEAVYKTLFNEFAKRNDSFGSAMLFLFNVIANQKNGISAGKAEAQNLPAVSVVISLFNYEKYVGECLDSLLEQTLKNFEVIVVDDCSTDNSVAIVESYIPKFGGRLKLAHTKENSGGGGVPRNIGCGLSRGKYVFFMDADDAFTKTALEEMYSVGEKFDADVVYCEKYFMSSGSGKEFKDNIRRAETKIQKPPFVTKPTLETADLTKRVQKTISLKYWMTAWLRLVRRDLLIENNIKFDSLVGSNDVNWTLRVLFCAKRFLLVPNACYIRRIHEESVSFRERTPSDYLHKWMDRTIRSLAGLDDFMKRIEFFQNNSDQRFRVIDWCLNNDFRNVSKYCKDLKPHQACEAFQQHFGGYLGEHSFLVSCLCAKLFDLYKEKREKEAEPIATANEIEQEQLGKLAGAFSSYLPARIGIKLKAKGDLRIVNMSDAQAKLTKPAWFQKDGTGYLIHFHEPKLEFVAKAAVSGQVILRLAGVSVFAPGDKSTRIPCWVDYTRLVVNGETLFDTATPVWHDKPYSHTINVKADEEVKILVEWAPHKEEKVAKDT